MLPGAGPLDERGQPTTQVRTGDAATFRVHYQTERRVPRPVFGIAVYTLEGIQVTGPNTHEADKWVDAIEGEGVVDLRVDQLLLLRSDL